jgi:hypothetical protein
MSNSLILLANPIKGYSFEQTLFAINAHDFGSLDKSPRFVFGVASSGACFHLNDYRYHKYPSNDVECVSAEEFSYPLPITTYMSEHGWFVLYVPATCQDSWQKTLTDLLKTISRERGVEYYEPLFKEGPLEPGKMTYLELEGHYYGCNGGGHQTSDEEREAAADEVTIEPAAEPVAAAVPVRQAYTYVPAPYSVSSPLEVLAAVARLCQKHKRDAYPAYMQFLGVIGKNGIFYTLDLISSCHSTNPKMGIAAEQHQDITAALPLSPSSSPHMWLVFNCGPESALPYIQAIYTDLRVSGEFEPMLPFDSPSVSTNLTMYSPEAARYKSYKSSKGTVFYIPTAPEPYSHLLIRPYRSTTTADFSDFTDLDDADHEAQRAFYEPRRFGE